MVDIIETADEFRRTLHEEAGAGRVDIRAETPSLRDTLRVSEAVSDWEIHQIVTETFRSDENPEVVFTLGGGMVVAQVYVPVDGTYSIGDELWRVESDLSNVYGGDVWLTWRPASAEGYGILTSYRMPAGDYGPEDWPLVERFGVECARYQQSRDRVAA